ncbi:MAG: SCO family protein [Proteobacteria bacterium]|nr:SCO family protein [Pseudomonadota bacterium]
MNKSLLATLLLILLFSIAIKSTLADSSVSGSELIKSKFNLVDHHGKNVTEQDYFGKYLLVFFGFTNCPKICPLGLTNLTTVLKKLGDKRDLIYPIFISVDPERDTVERMSEYLKNFDPNIIGLTGTAENIEEASKSYRAYYGKIKGVSKEQYSFDHSSLIYLMDKDGSYLSSFPSNQDAENMAKQIREFLKE